MKGAVAAAVAALGCSAAATAAAATGPDVSTMTLQLTDVPGAVQESAGPVKETGYVAYERTFGFATPAGPSRMVYVQSEVMLAPTAVKAASDLAAVARVLRTKAAQRGLAAELAQVVSVNPKAVKVGKPKTPAVGDHAFEVPLTVTAKGIRIYGTLLYVQFDRTIVVEVLDGLRPEGATSERLSRISVAHITTALTPVSATAPTITGTAVQGQTLTALPATWSIPAATTYRWQRCDATGANCVDVDGATATTYVVSAADAGFTLRVVATAASRFGNVDAPSAVTAVVT